MKSFTAHIKRASRKIGLAVIALSSVGMYQSVLAAPGQTSANTQIDNQATVNYQVSGVNQSGVLSNTAGFKVDKIVDLTVTSGSGKSPFPGATAATQPAQVGLPYTVSNEGNDSDVYTLTIADVTGTDTFNPTSYALYLDSGATGVTGVYDNTDTLIGNTGSTITIPRDASRIIHIVSVIPVYADAPANTIPLVSGNTASLTLRATTTSVQSTTEAANTVDVVWADGTVATAGYRNGWEESTNTYTIQTASLTVVKSRTVLADPINCPTGVGSCGANVPMAIPGATIQYSIVVTNTSALDNTNATSVGISDTLAGTLTYVPGSISKTGGTAAAPTNANVVGQVVTVPVGTLEDTNTTTGSAPGSNTATVTFRVTLL